MAVTVTERLRLRLLFGGLTCVPVFLAGWLAWLQIFQRGELRHVSGAPLRLSPAAADMQRDRRDLLPSPRGTIVDRHGATLAIDCEAFDVRAEIRPPRKALTDCKELRLYLAEIVEKLSAALVRDPGLADRAEALKDYRAKLQERVRKAFDLDALPASGEIPKEAKTSGEFLVDGEVAVQSVLEALDELDNSMQSLHLQMLRTHIRSYPERDLTYGLIGYLQDQPILDAKTSRVVGFAPQAPLGLEALAALSPGAPGERVFRIDSSSRRYYSGPANQPEIGRAHV